ncbi:unnamed protein product [Heligmosomoides polygyrus]|uniref:Reverse transcriptase domain-containing protein n=1 Tax=Heligmosomoides polygyrus TaxID=6339 RepID=A0A183FKC0_HELPZ|nr:unnamed protein product [Heligmosomoides polygyrus]
MLELEWEDMGVKVDGRQLHHLRCADDIVLITPSMSQALRMPADFDRVCGNVGLQLDLTKTMFMRNGLVSDAPLSPNGFFYNVVVNVKRVVRQRDASLITPSHKRHFYVRKRLTAGTH